ncbi:pentapeptide repeat-containing protein [Saccharothrix sp.]|uniref:pentapeptide repeat-containing protein n=1 Tax=Saccharothrix sp. TaxID=1873460 RepID=UPI0028127ED8|nr:pentapeptide repeat-containing protein [Saccharothrix sp.]
MADVLCAYLRAPYTPPADKPGTRRLGGLPGGLRGNPHRRVTTTAAIRRAVVATPAPTPTDEQRRQEREVRLTAQRILTRHLHPGDHPRRRPDTFWPDTDLELTGATLIDFDFSQCRPRHAHFNGASFAGTARFVGASFAGTAVFDEASFAGDAVFDGASFARDAGFDEASFAGTAWFDGASFAGTAWFDGASFAGDARFDEASFAGTAWFGVASFAGPAVFGGASFAGTAGFGVASFAGDAWFGGASFAGDAWFGGASFAGDARFGGAWFERPVVMAGATARRDRGGSGAGSWPPGWSGTADGGPVDGQGEWVPVVPIPVVLPTRDPS